MIDIHTHILPCIDDGANSIQETMKMVEEASATGFTDIITTSHYIDNHYDINKSDREQIITGLNEVLKGKVKLHNGAEAYITPNLVELYENKTIPTLANSRYVLFELPLNTDVIYLKNVIKDLHNYNYIPILAHPERYKIMQKNIERAYELAESGVLLQCNYGSFNGRYGNSAQKTVIKLLRKNKISFLGSDAHRSESIYKIIPEVLNKLEKTIGYEMVEQLTRINPQKILDNEYFD